MRHLTFSINGTDLSSLCNDYGYTAGATPVYSREVTTMAQKRRSTVARWRGYCILALNDITDAEAATLAAALREGTLLVTYRNPAFGLDPVTQDMTVDGVELGYLLSDVSGTYWSGKTIRFDER